MIDARLAELEIPYACGRHHPPPRKVTPPAGIQSLASEVIVARAGVSREDLALLGRAADGMKLRGWELRRVEYLAVKAMAAERSSKKGVTSGN